MLGFVFNDPLVRFRLMLVPVFLQKNDKVAIVATAKKLQSSLSSAIRLLESWGLEVALGKHLYRFSGVFAGTDQQRFEDMQWALDDPSIKAVMIARGGYGTTRILDRLDFSRFRKHPKWVVGFSDVTTLLHQINNLGITAIHATMPALMGKEGAEEADQSLQTALFGKPLSYTIKSHPFNKSGMVKAELTGGNLSMICNSIGTSSEINTDGKILFLEEVGEYAYHIDRLVVQLARAGKLENLKGMVIGHFTDVKKHQDPFGLNVYEIIKQHVDKMDFPVCFDFPVGHAPKNLALYCGAEAKFEVQKAVVSLSFDKKD